MRPSERNLKYSGRKDLSPRMDTLGNEDRIGKIQKSIMGDGPQIQYSKTPILTSKKIGSGPKSTSMQRKSPMVPNL